MEKIKYKHNYSKDPIDDNTQEVIAFIGEIPSCPICGGCGEYDTEYGEVGCPPCNSRCLPFIDFQGKRDYLDWEETLERHADGLHKIEKPHSIPNDIALEMIKRDKTV